MTEITRQDLMDLGVQTFGPRATREAARLREAGFIRATAAADADVTTFDLAVRGGEPADTLIRMAHAARGRARLRDGEPKRIKDAANDGWPMVALWFGSLALVIPGRTRGVGLLACVSLMSRVWSAHEDQFEDRVQRALDELAARVDSDLEDRAAFAETVADLETSVADLRVIGRAGVHSVANAMELAKGLGYPVRIRPAYVESEGMVVRNDLDLDRWASAYLMDSPTGEIIVTKAQELA